MHGPEKIKAPQALKQMLASYTLNSLQDHTNAIKEIVQEIALLGLWRAKFFEKAAFYGGTALRILHQLDRFSEDLDFTLLKHDDSFDLKEYESAIQNELFSLGFKAIVKKKNKTKTSAVDSAFIKVNTLEHLLLIDLPRNLNQKIHPDEVIKIRLEIDTDPPPVEMITENKLLLLPIPFSIKTLQLEDLFAGKIAAVLCREWKGRVKGRDWYDLIWFVARSIPVRLIHLEKRMIQSGHWDAKNKLTSSKLLILFQQKIQKLDIASAKLDIINFISDPAQINLWSKDFFLEIASRIQVIP